MHRYASSAAFVALALGTVSQAHAAPTLYPRPGSRVGQLHNDTATYVLADNVDPDTFYVVPPGAGSAELASPYFSANIAFCQEMSGLQQTSRLLSQRRQQLMEELEASESEIGLLSEELHALQRIADDLFALITVRDEYRGLTELIEQLEEDIEILYERIDACERRDDECLTPIYDELDETERELSQARRDLRALKRLDVTAIRNFERAQGNADAAEAELDARRDENLASQLQLNAMHAQLFDMYARFGRIEGSLASVNFETGWEEAMDELRGVNPGSTFLPLPTQDARAFVNLVPGLGSDAYLTQMPSVLSLAVNGQETDYDSFEQVLPGVPDTFVATARLSLIGACPMHRPERFDLEKGENGLPLFGLSATYAYPAAFQTRASATYNSWKLYEYMKRNSRTNGLFRTKSKVEMEETAEGRSVIEITWFDDSGQEADRRAAIEEQIRLDLQAEVLHLMGKPEPTPLRAQIDATLPPTGDSGAMLLSRGAFVMSALSGFTGMGYAFLLRGAQQTFGSSVAETRFKQTYDYSVTRDYDAETVYLRHAMLTFPNEE
jgi:hypothetical protein